MSNVLDGQIFVSVRYEVCEIIYFVQAEKICK